MSAIASRAQRFADSVAGIELTREVGRGAHSVVYEGLHGDLKVAVKVSHPVDTGIGADEAGRRLLREAATLARVPSKGLVRTLQVGLTEQGRPCLVLEYVEGPTLASVLAKGPLPESQVIAIAISIAETLCVVHARDIVHRDIKPENLLLPEGQPPKLIDFGLAIAAEARVEDGMREVVGTFAYSAPEQTGMFKRPVDGRSDLYSLGIVLFECVTGAPPFLADDVATLLKMHANRVAPDIRALTDDVSVGFARVVAKLIAKDPDDRYQSAHGLLHDLRRLARNNLPDDAALDVLRTPPWYARGRSLVGRNRELSTLERFHAQAAGGLGSAVVLLAPGGHGKTRLCQALAHNAAQSGGLVWWARCIRDQQSPLAALGEGVSHLLTQLAATSTSREALTAELTSLASDDAPYLLRLFPELSPFVPGVVADQDPNTEPEVLCEAAAQLALRLARRYMPMLIVVDDAQWADSATRRVVARLTESLGDVGLFVVWASRFADETSESLRVATTLELLPLNETSVAQMIENRLYTDRIDPAIAQQILTRSQGVPRAIDEYVKALVDAEALTPSWGSWTLDAEKLQSLALPNDLEQLVVWRAKALPDTVSEIAQVAALIGRRFHVEVLEACIEDDARVRDALVATHRAGLIERLPGEAYGFVHDAAHEALLLMLPDERRPGLHRRISAAEEARIELDPDALTRAAQHGYLGRDASTAAHTYALSLRAGARAQLGLANREARELFENAEKIAGEYGVAVDHELYRGLAEARVQMGELLGAIGIYEKAIECCEEPVAKSLLHSRCCEIYGWTGVAGPAVEAHLETAWNLLGMKLHRNRLLLLLNGLFWLAYGLFMERTGFRFGRDAGKPVAEARWKAILAGCQVAYAQGDVPMLVHMASRELHAGNLSGRSRVLIDAWGAFGAALDSFQLPSRWADAFYTKAYKLSGELADKIADAKLRFWHGVGLNQRGAPLQAAEAHEHALLRCRHLLPLDVQVVCSAELGLNRATRGYAREALDFAQEMTKRSLGTEDRRSNALSQVLVTSQLLLGDLKETWRVCQVSTASLSKEVVDTPMVQFSIALYSAVICIESEDYARLEEHLDRAEALAPPAYMVPWHFCAFFIYRGLGRLALWENAKEHERPARLLQLKAAVRAARPIARHTIHRPHYTLLAALCAWAEGNLQEAEQLAWEAQRLACAADHPAAEFDALRLLSRLFRETRRFAPAERCARAALAIAERGGWEVKIKRVRRDLGERGTSRRTSADTYATHGPMTHTSSALHAAHGARALMEVSLATAQVVNPREQAVVALDKLVGVLGAERGVLFRWEEGEGLIFEVGRDASGHALPIDVGIARSLVQRVAETRTPIVLAGTDQGKALGSESVVAYDLRSIMCAPLMLRDKLMGVIYLDSRLARCAFADADLQILLAIANQIVVAQESALSAQRAIAARELERDLQASTVVQSLLLPATTEVRTEHFELAAMFRPMGHAGGDFWQWDVSDDETLRIWVFDVTGHGVGAAMMGAAVSGCYRSVRASRYGLSTEEIVEQMHRTLCEVGQGAYGIPLAVLELPKRGNARYVSAGAPPLLLWTRTQGISVKQCGGTPLGSEALIMRSVSFPVDDIERLLMTSDGVLEMSVATGKQLGVRRLRQLFSEREEETAIELRDRIAGALESLRGEAPLDDDLTLVAITRTRR